MNYDIQQKIKVFDLMAGVSVDSVEKKLQSAAGSSVLKSSKFQLKKFRENAAILENYRQQMAGLSPKKPVSKKQAEKAWAAMEKICDGVLPLMANNSAALNAMNQADRKAMQSYQMMLEEYKGALTKGNHYEQQYQAIPESFAPAAGAGNVPAFNSADALYLTDNLASGQSMTVLNRLSRNPLLTGTPELKLASLAQDLQAMNDYHLQMPGDVAGGAKKAFADLRANGETILANIDLLMSKEAPDSRNYQDLQDYKLLVTDCCYTVSLADQRALQRQFDEQKQELALMTSALEDIINPDKAEPGMEDDDNEFKNDPEDVYARSIRDNLSGYALTGASENAFAIEFERVNTEIQAKKAALPAGMAERFSEYRTPEQLARLHTLAQQELAQPGSTGDPMLKKYASNIDLFIDMRLSQSKQAILVSQNQAQYEQYAAQEQERIKNGPDQVLRSSLGVMARQMSGMHKYWFNSTSYNKLQKALNKAAAGGDTQELLLAAQKYVNDKQNGNPTSENGIRRLAMAKAIVAMLTKANEKKAFAASLPAPKPEEAPAEPESMEESEQIDFNFSSVIPQGPAAPDAPIEPDVFDPYKTINEPTVPMYQPHTNLKAVKLPKDAPKTETEIKAQDVLSWPDTDQNGFSVNRNVIRGTIQARLAAYPPEKRQEIADKIYGLINRHLSGHDLNGYTNFIKSAREELFESHNGQPPLMDAKDDIFLHAIGQLIVHKSNFIPKQVALYQQLKTKDPNVNPFNQPNALAAGVPKSTGAEKVNELKIQRVLDMVFDLDVSYKTENKYALHHAVYTKMYYGTPKEQQYLAKMPQEWLQQLSDSKSHGEYLTEGNLLEALSENVQKMPNEDYKPVEYNSKNYIAEHVEKNPLEY